MAFSTPLAVGYALEGERFSRVGAAVAFLLTVGLFLTAKESAVLGFLAGIGVFVALWAVAFSRTTLSFLSDRRVIVGAAISSLGLLVAVWYLSRLVATSHSASIRLRQYFGGIHMALDNPLFGVGGANYAYLAPEYGLPAHLGGSLFPIHSMVIGMAAETGIVGGVLFLTAFVFVLRAAVVTWRRVPSAFHAGIVAAVVAYGVVALFVMPL